ncbi:MAG: hypothetical protein KDI73_00235, partial [Candidatus Competibacteraceae bacterium]|nr:hypothetical protein [Candidatus Competibacteraceae bacterium]
LIQAIAAKVRGEVWSFAMDFRPLAEAWEAAITELEAALDQRFGPGLGRVVAMVENFDTLTRNLFGSGVAARKKTASARAIEQNAAEQLLRKLMNRKDSRLMLIASATGTVDQDYERPLFQAFKTIDLRIWTSDDCIAYFNHRRALERQATLSPQEEARARAIAEFIGGNPRLAQLLGEVLATPDARSIAATLDALSDHLADYYRHRLDDLPPQSAALLDALIRKGEPCTQTELAARVNASSQAQIADAFSYLLSSRLLAAGSDKTGAGKLYRLRDRLFVHFYRRRYGEPEQALGLAPIAELLESFFAQREREEQVRRHLEAGEWADARLYALNSPLMCLPSDGFCGYRDGTATGTPGELFRLVGCSPDAAIDAQTELKLHSELSIKRWRDAANCADTGLRRTAALLLEAISLSRCQMDDQAEKVLEEALGRAEMDGDQDSRILVLHNMAVFTCHRRKDPSKVLELSAQIGTLAGKTRNDVVRVIALCSKAWHLSTVEIGHYPEAVDVYDEAAELASKVGSPHLQARALRGKAYSLNQLKRYDEAALLAKQSLDLATAAGMIHNQIEALIYLYSALSKLDQHELALESAQTAYELAVKIGDVDRQAVALDLKGWKLAKLGRIDEASDVFDMAFDAAKSGSLPQGLIFILKNQANSLRWKKSERTLILARDILTQTSDVISKDALWTARRIFFEAATRAHAPDVVEMFEICLAEVTTEENTHPLADMLAKVLAAVTYNDLWDELAACLSRHPQTPIFSRTWRPFSEIGRVWSAQVKANGRAQTYAAIARQLPAIVQLIEWLPLEIDLESLEDKTLSQLHSSELINGLLNHCDDAGFLQDIAELLKEGFGKKAEAEIQRLQAFAEVHAASDKEAVLQRLDPNLAHAIRRIWGFPEPDDLLMRKGRRKGR